MRCEEITAPTLLPGWGCCQCRTYNGPQNKKCRICGHPVCSTVDRKKLGRLAEEKMGRKMYDPEDLETWTST